MLTVLDQQNTVLNTFIAEMRDVNIQTDSMRFRRNMERVGEILAYEISKSFTYASQVVETPLGEAEVKLSHDKVVLATILRAGLPFHQGFLNYFDRAENAFISAYRKYSKDGTFNIKIEYISCGNLTDKTLILVDPMLATGESLVLTHKALIEKGGKPAFTHIAAAVGSEEGVDFVRRHMSKTKTAIWCGSVDQELTVKSYIVPGMGDAGDLAYGDKL